MSGAVKGRAVWPQRLKPVAWNNDGDRVRMKIGLYHAKDEVADGEVEYKNISIEGPAGRIRTSSRRIPDESKYLGCYKDRVRDRVLTGDSMSRNDMTPQVRRRVLSFVPCSVEGLCARIISLLERPFPSLAILCSSTWRARRTSTSKR